MLKDYGKWCLLSGMLLAYLFIFLFFYFFNLKLKLKIQVCSNVYKYKNVNFIEQLILVLPNYYFLYIKKLFCKRGLSNYSTFGATMAVGKFLDYIIAHDYFQCAVGV